MMDGMQDFSRAVLEELNKILPDGRTGALGKVRRFNGAVSEAVVIGDEEDSILPMVYLDGYYAAFRHNGVTAGDIATDILRRIEEGAGTEEFLSGLPYGDWEAVRGHIFFHLVNAGMNRKLLEDIPHVPYLDLAVVFRVILECGDGTDATVLVRNGLARCWGMDTVSLMAQAEKNTPYLLQEKVQSMDSLLRGLSGGTVPDMKMPMYIASNSTGLYGSGVILYKDFLRKMAAGFGEGFYLLPSSIHEWIAVPETEAGCTEELSRMVREVNAEAVPEEAVLSDHAYYFNSRENKVRCA